VHKRDGLLHLSPVGTLDQLQGGPALNGIKWTILGVGIISSSSQSICEVKNVKDTLFLVVQWLSHKMKMANGWMNIGRHTTTPG